MFSNQPSRPLPYSEVPLLIGFKKPIIMQAVSGNKLHREKLAFKSSELARDAT